jgi:hypothetical protein
MGFIVSIEAIVAFLQKKEGAPISGIFVELSEKFLTVFIVRSGNVIDIKHGAIDESVEQTVEKLLGQVTSLDVLPSKIILLHNKEAENVQQKFLSHHWTKELPFMHLPQVAILERGFENEAIINGVATQLNVTVKGDVNVSTVEEIGDGEDVISQSDDTFGFVQEKDVGQQEKVVKKPVEDKKPDKFEFSEEQGKSPIIKHAGEEVLEEDEPTQEVQGEEGVGKKSFLATFFTPETFSKLPKLFGNGKKLIIPLIALVVVVLIVGAYYAFFLKAQVIVFTDKKAFAQDSLAITLTTSGDSSFEDKTLKVSTLDEEVKGEESQETTGQKDTGQKATGTMTIFNKTEQPKQLEKGKVITSSNNLDFTLNDAVTIASTSSFSTSFTNVQAKVTASNFGKEYNIPSQTNFTIKGISTSDIFGRNDSAFSGGTKEEIQVVSKKDLQALENTVSKRLLDKAKSEVSSKLNSDEALVPVELASEFKDKTFDKKEDDKAKSVKLTATIVFTLGIYKKEELAKFISSSNEFDVPKDFKLSDSESSIKISDIKQNKNETSAKLSFNAIFKPQLDTSKIPQEITGKSISGATAKLKSTPGVSDVTILFPNKLPYLPLLVPLNKGNISVDVKSQAE